MNYKYFNTTRSYRLEVLKMAVVTMMIVIMKILLVLAPCILVGRRYRFEETYCLLLQGYRCTKIQKNVKTKFHYRLHNDLTSSSPHVTFRNTAVFLQ